MAEIPELVEGVRKHGLGMKMLFRPPGAEGKHNGFNWAGKYSFGQEFCPTDDDIMRREKAEKQVRRLTNDFKWLEDGSLELTQHIPGEYRTANVQCAHLIDFGLQGIRKLSTSGRPVWFNGLAGRHGITRDIGALDPPHIGRDGMTCE